MELAQVDTDNSNSAQVNEELVEEGQQLLEERFGIQENSSEKEKNPGMIGSLMSVFRK